MAETSNIAWTDATFNHVTGCTKVSPACEHCYAANSYTVKARGIKWGPESAGGTRVMAAPSGWKHPEKWNRAAERDGVRRRVFCASLADVFEDWSGPILDHHGNRLAVDDSGRYRAFTSTEHSWESEFLRDHGRWATMDDLRRDLFALIDRTPHLDWLLLTKRPENVRRMWPDSATVGRDPLTGRGLCPQCGTTVGVHGGCDCGLLTPCFGDHPNTHRKNCWLGTTTENQHYADLRIPELEKCRDLAPVLFLSVEPQLEAIDLRPWLSQLDWVITGCESKQGADHVPREYRTEWAELLISQCHEANVPVFVKQANIDGKAVIDIDRFPKSIQVREFPCGESNVQNV